MFFYIGKHPFPHPVSHGYLVSGKVSRVVLCDDICTGVLDKVLKLPGLFAEKYPEKLRSGL